VFGRKPRTAEEPQRAPESSEPTAGRAKKDRPTPSRKEAEAARRQRVTRNLSKREARQEAARANRQERLRTVSVREAVPEKALMRDYVDSRFSVGEFLLPSLVLILATTFLASALPQIAWYTTLLMYAYILVVLVDLFLMWRGFKRVLAERLPRASTKGLALYGMNRAIQLRRFRAPRPRLKRGDRF
jgi:Flp pilus assembly protein TadB